MYGSYDNNTLPFSRRSDATALLHSVRAITRYAMIFGVRISVRPAATSDSRSRSFSVIVRRTLFETRIRRRISRTRTYRPKPNVRKNVVRKRSVFSCRVHDSRNDVREFPTVYALNANKTTRRRPPVSLNDHGDDNIRRRRYMRLAGTHTEIDRNA